MGTKFAFPRKSHWSDFPGKSRQMRAKSSKVETSERNLAHGHQIECRDRSSWCPTLAHFQDDSFICSRTSFQLAHKISIPNGSYLTEPFWKSEWIESVPLMTTYYFNCLATQYIFYLTQDYAESHLFYWYSICLEHIFSRFLFHFNPNGSYFQNSQLIKV